MTKVMKTRIIQGETMLRNFILKRCEEKVKVENKTAKGN